MPGNLTNTLYAPAIATFMPAFVNTTDAVVYFTLSPYNSSSSIQRVHVSLVNQLNNENALTKASGILISNLNYNTTNGMYYVTIPVTYVEGGQFNINQFYKVQLRFDCYDGEVPTDEKELNAYFLDYQTYFSEWSTVCLIRPILQPSIQLRTFDTYEGDKIAFNKGIIPISGKMFFGDGSTVETETLQSYEIQVLDANEDTVLLNSPVIYTGDNIDPNDINYRIDLQGLDTSNDSQFRLRIIATTKNQYVLTKTYDFQIAEFLDEDSFNPTLTVTMDNETATATLSVRNVQTVFGTLYIKRASSVDNFKTWEDIYVAKIAGPIDLQIADNTVGSFIWYRYSAQLENSRGALTQVYHSNQFLPDFYDAFLSRGTDQFKIAYNFNISNMKPVVNRAKLDTLGGRFPKFAENAILNYKQFSISGLISAEADVYERFLNKQKYFDSNYTRYQVYKEDHDIVDLIRNDVPDYLLENNSTIASYRTTTWQDFLWEREFREEAIKWLNDGEPKLFRSMTEGVLAVMLTDISLTPNASTSRMNWNFTATMYEVAEATSLAALDSLGIYETTKLPDNLTNGGNGGGGSIDPEPEYVEVVKIGQLYNHTVTDKNNIISGILNDLKVRYGGVLEDKLPDNLYLKNVKIFFTSPPNVYLQNGTDLALVENPGNTQLWSQEQRDRMMLGYTFRVQTSASDGESLIFVNSRGYYQLPNNLDVTGLYFEHIGDEVTIEYTMVYKEKNNNSTIISGPTVDRTLLGQYCGTYMPNQYMGEAIRAKYNFIKTGEYFQKMQYWTGICVDVNPFAVLHLQYRGETEYKDYVVGETGVFHLLKNFPVQDLCFLGRRMNQQPIERQPFLEEWEYVLDGSVDGSTIISRTSYWNEDVNHPVGINYDNSEQEYPDSWLQVYDVEDPTDGAGYFSTNEIPNPKLNTVYKVNGALKIYYQYQWYDFEQQPENTGLAKVPVEGMINYVGNVIRSDL